MKLCFCGTVHKRPSAAFAWGFATKAAGFAWGADEASTRCGSKEARQKQHMFSLQNKRATQFLPCSTFFSANRPLPRDSKAVEPQALQGSVHPCCTPLLLSPPAPLSWHGRTERRRSEAAHATCSCPRTTSPTKVSTDLAAAQDHLRKPGAFQVLGELVDSASVVVLSCDSGWGMLAGGCSTTACVVGNSMESAPAVCCVSGSKFRHSHVEPLITQVHRTFPRVAISCIQPS